MTDTARFTVTARKIRAGIWHLTRSDGLTVTATRGVDWWWVRGQPWGRTLGDIKFDLRFGFTPADHAS